MKPEASEQDPDTEVPLSGVRAEFRTALRQEIEAARRNASSGALPLVNGRQIAQVGAGYQYVFDIENVLNVPGDAPGDLLVPGRQPIEVIIISVEGLAITLSVPVDLGGFVPSARLRSNLTLLMRKLISRIEALGDTPNPSGDRIRGAGPVSGSPAAVDTGELKRGQAEAVSSALGRDTTFIWGPPGTGKTRTIGAIGAALFARDRSLLMVSHTNTAVDQALLKIADDLRPTAGEAIKAGKVLRVGDPADPRLRDSADLLMSTHVARRSAELSARRDELLADHDEAVVVVLALGRRIAIAEWVADAVADVSAMHGELADLSKIDDEHQSVRAGLDGLEVESQRWAEAAAAATIAMAKEASLALLREEAVVLKRRQAALLTEVDRAATAQDEATALLAQAIELAPNRARARVLPSFADQTVAAHRARDLAAVATKAHEEVSTRFAEADAILTETKSVNALTRRWRRLPAPDEHQSVVEDLRARAAAAAETRAQAEAAQTAAEATLAEVARLSASLIPHAEVPDADTQAGAAMQAEESHRHARGQLDLCAAAIASADANGAQLDADVGAFVAHYGDPPAGILARAEAHDVEIGEARTQVDQLHRASNTRRQALEDLLDSRLSVLRDWRLTVARSTTAEAMLDAIKDAHRAATAEHADVDLVELRAEQHRTNERIRTIEAEVAEILELLKKVEDLVISDAIVVATTLTRAYLRDSIQARRFDTVVLDEASMAPIPALWVAASLADANVVAVGDHLQLPPIVISTAPEALRWLGTDVFEAAGITDHRTAPEHFVALTEQFRMHPDISAIPNAMVYDHLLTNGAGTESDASLSGWYRRDWGHDSPVLLVDTGTTGAWVTSVARGERSSRLNFLSATVCVDLAEQLLLEGRPELPVGATARILIVCPYRPHAQFLELLLRENGLAGEVRAGTAHTFQGSEADIVILDLVNDEPHWKVGLFMASLDENTKRMLNVALTRARRRLIVVGDFDYITKNAKKAFLGARLLPFLRERYPVADALDIVPAGLAARAAKRQTAALGGSVEPTADRVVVTHEHFFAMLAGDLARARQRVVIYSAFVTANRIAQLEPQLRAAVERNVAVYVVTKALADRGKRDQSEYRSLESALTNWGVIVVHKRNMHEKLVLVDDDVLWSGSLNPLSFSDTQEIMERRRSRRVVDDYARTLRLKDLVGEYEGGPPECPICGGEVIASEGKNDPFYWRCVEDDCYSRGIDQAPLIGGVLTCTNCAGPVEWGEWGGDPAWRCTTNRHHHQRVARTHLRLPKMRAIIPKRELRRAEKRFGLDAPPKARVETLF